MSLTLDQLVAHVFEDENLGRVARNVRAGGAEEGIGRFRDAWEDWASTWEPPSLPAGQLRPFAFNSWSGYDSGGLASAWMELVARPDGAGQLSQQIVRHLLFCDSVAVPDPFFRSPDGDFIRPRWVDREGFAAAIDSVNRFNELIRRNIIVVVPRQHGPIPEAQMAMDSTAAELFPPPPEDWWGFKEYEVVALDLAMQVATADGAFDPYLPSATHLEIFRRLVKAADKTIRQAMGEASPSVDHMLLHEFLRCQLPDPVGVTVADIVAIRKDGGFDRWRKAVAAGVKNYIDVVGAEPDSWPNSDKALSDEIAEAVRNEAQDAQKEMGWMNRPAVRAVFNGVLVAGGVTAVFVPPVGIAMAGAGAFPFLAEAFDRYRGNRSSLSRHVAVFARN